MKIATVFEATVAAQKYVKQIWSGEVMGSSVIQDGGIYHIWVKLEDGMSHLVYVDVNTGAVIDNVLF